MFERRAHVRIAGGLHGRYLLARKMDSPRLGFTQDISMGGMQMACQERLEPGERVAIDLPLLREGEVGLTGVILWSRKSDATSGSYEVGMKWAGLDPAVQARLSSYINSYTRVRSTPAMAAVIHREPVISWPRTIGLAVFLAASLLAAAELWISSYEMSLGNRAFRSTLSAQQLLQSRITAE